jgi:hypothetical protein
MVMDIDEFQEIFPDCEFLENNNGCTRLSNGLGEGTDYESAWFCNGCGAEVEDIFEGCGCDDKVR